MCSGFSFASQGLLDGVGAVAVRTSQAFQPESTEGHCWTIFFKSNEGFP